MPSLDTKYNCLLRSLGVREVVGSRPDRGNIVTLFILRVAIMALNLVYSL